MIYLENASKGLDGFTTHLMSYTIAMSLSNFLERPFYLDYEVPCSTPPDFASRDEYKDKFAVLLNSPRSIVSQLIDMPADRIFEIDLDVPSKAQYQMLISYFITTDEMKAKFGKTPLWDFFGFGRFDITREHLQQYELIEWTHSKVTNPSCFYFLPRAEKNALLKSIEIRFIPEIERLAADIISDVGGAYNAVHLRLGDFLTNYSSDEYRVNVERFKKYVEVNFEDRSLPVLIATDALYETEMFAAIFVGYETIFIDERIFDVFRDRYESLPFTDFSVLTILNQLICASAEIFIGTFRSTFTGMIHRVRQERNGYKDFNFFPDDRVARLLDENMRITKDRSGFFDWNRYAALTPDHESLSWRREWDFDRTSVDF